MTKKASFTRVELSETAAEIAKSQNILKRLDTELRDCGFAGSTNVPLLIYLALQSRFSIKPVSIAVLGESAAGKSHSVTSALDYIPDAAVERVSSMSEKGLVYSGLNLKHRYLYIGELAGMSGETGSTQLRQLLSDGKVTHRSVGKNEKGEQAGTSLTIEGPMAVLLTTTRKALHPEDASRLLLLTIPNDQEQTRAVLRAQALGFSGARKAVGNFPPWHEVHDWIASQPTEVVVPFALQLAEQFNLEANRAKRDFPQVVGLIMAHALLHQCSRQKDTDGTIIAELQDYEAVYGLIADQMQLSAAGDVDSNVRRLVKAVETLTSEHPEYADGVPQNVLADTLVVSPSSISRWKEPAIELGHLVNKRTADGAPSKLLPGDPLPEHCSILPKPSLVQANTQ